MQRLRQNYLLLLEDIHNVGRKGATVVVKPGFANNYLLPQKKAVVVNKHTLHLQERLQKERQQQAEMDLKQSEELQKQLENKVFIISVKVDSTGHLYGSVSALDIVHLLIQEGYAVEKKSIRLAHPIKSLGEHPVTVFLKEGITTRIVIKVEQESINPPEDIPAASPQE